MIRAVIVFAALAAMPAMAADYTYKPSATPALTAALQTPKPAAPAASAEIPARKNDGAAPQTLIPGGQRPVAPNRYLTETYGTSHGQNCGVPDCSNVVNDRSSEGLSDYAQQNYRKYHGGQGYHRH